MKHLKQPIILFFILSLIVISCGKPPENAQYTNALELLNFFLEKIMDLKGNHEKLKAFQQEGMNQNVVIEIYKDSEIILRTKRYQEPAKNGREEIGYSLSDNQYMLLKDLYFTNGKGKNEFLFSFDQITWYSSLSKSDDKRKVENLFIDYFIDTNYNKEAKTLSVLFYGMAEIGSDPLAVPAPSKREVMKIRKNLVLFNDNGRADVDLNKTILWIPKNTVLEMIPIVTGNLAMTKLENGVIYTKFLQDIFVYYKKKSISISFDKVDWGVSILDFSIKNSTKATAVEDDKINIVGTIDAVYKGKKNK